MAILKWSLRFVFILLGLSALVACTRTEPSQESPAKDQLSGAPWDLEQSLKSRGFHVVAKPLITPRTGVPHNPQCLQTWQDDRIKSISQHRPTFLYFGEMSTNDPDKLKQAQQIEFLIDETVKQIQAQHLYLTPAKCIKFLIVDIDNDGEGDPAWRELIQTYDSKHETPRQLIFDSTGKVTWAATGVVDMATIRGE